MGSVDWNDFVDQQVEIDGNLLNCLRILNTMYFVYGYEVGNGRNLHIQGYMEFNYSTRRSTITNAFGANHLPAPHLEGRMGTRQQAIDYCKKEGMFIQSNEEGEREEVKNKRSAMVDMVKEHGYAWVVKNELEGAHLLNKPVCQLYDDLTVGPSRYNDPPVQFNWYFGRPGAGKTYAAEMWVSNGQTEEFTFKHSGERLFATFNPRMKNALIDNITLNVGKEAVDNYMPRKNEKHGKPSCEDTFARANRI
jgi:hypothetical protein